MNHKYPNLFSPIKVGPLVYKNRIISAPTSLADLSPHGHLTRDNTEYYKRKAKGGAAVVTVGESIVHSPTGKSHPLQILLDDPTVMPSLVRTADAIKQYGAIASIQISHGGCESNPRHLNGNTPVGPSPIRKDKDILLTGPAPYSVDEMSEALMNEIADSFAAGAEVVKRTGFDMCMIHGGHGWLIAQFLSPLWNKRKDKFGGSLENRTRFPLMILDRIREAVGLDFPIEFRISGSELTDGGFTLEDAIEICKIIETRVDLIHVSAGTFAKPSTSYIMHPSMFLPHGCNAYLAEAIKKEVKIPVVTVGSHSDPKEMEQIIAQGKADIIAVARGLIADPDLPNKAKTGRSDEIMPCLRCFECQGGMYATSTMKCSVNPVIGREFQTSIIQPAMEHKKVLIAGGGPGGMQAAITAAERGHDVTLCEKTDSLGGMLKYAAHASFKKDLQKFCEYQVRRVNSLAVKVRLNTEVTPAYVSMENPDVLIVALGGKPIVPEIPGIDKQSVVMAQDIGKEDKEIGKKVIVVGGGQVGCETGLDLAQKGKEVTVLEMLDAVAVDANIPHRAALMIELDKYLTLQTGTRCTAITDKGVVCVDNKGNEKTFEADSVIIAVGMKSLSDEAEEMRDLAPDFFRIGDCLKPRKILHAVRAGYDAAMSIV